MKFLVLTIISIPVLSVYAQQGVGIAIDTPSNRLHVHDPDVYMTGIPPFVLTYGDTNHIQVTNGVSGAGMADGLRVGVGQGGQGQILHPTVMRLATDPAGLQLVGATSTINLDSNLYISDQLTVQSLSGEGTRFLVAEPSGVISTTTVDSSSGFEHFQTIFNTTTWIVPAEVTRIQVELWGGGGSGGPGGGGQSGAYIRGIMDVTPGESLSITIGDAGSGGGDGGNTIVSRSSDSYTAFGGDCGDNGPGLEQAGGLVNGSLSEYVVFPGNTGRSNKIYWNQSSSTDFVKIVEYGDGGSSYGHPGSGGAGRTRVTDPDTGTTIELGNGTTGRRPGGGGGGNFLAYNGGQGMVIIHW